MADAVATLTYDLTIGDGGPRRPSLADVGNATLVDDDPAPDKASMPYADQLNQWALQIAAMGRVCPVAIVLVTISAGTPAVANVTAPGTNVGVSSFSVVDHATGDTSLTWASDLLPAPLVPGKVSIYGATPGMISLDVVSVTEYRVRTLNSAGAAADLHWIVEIF